MENISKDDLIIFNEVIDKLESNMKLKTIQENQDNYYYYIIYGVLFIILVCILFYIFNQENKEPTEPKEYKCDYDKNNIFKNNCCKSFF